MRSRTRTAPLVLALGTTAAVVTGLVSPLAASAAAPTSPYISEIHYDNAGTDVDEFVEVTLPAGTVERRSERRALQRQPRHAPRRPTTPTPLPGGDRPLRRAPPWPSSSYPADGLQNGAPDGLALVDGTEVARVPLLRGRDDRDATGPAAGHDEHRHRRARGRHRRRPASPCTACTTPSRTPWSGTARRANSKGEVNDRRPRAGPAGHHLRHPGDAHRRRGAGQRRRLPAGRRARSPSRRSSSATCRGLGGFHLQDAAATATATPPPPTASSWQLRPRSTSATRSA